MNSKLKVCTYCTRIVPMDTRKRQRGFTCGGVECSRLRDRDRKRAERAAIKARETASEAPGGLVQRVVAPWGQEYVTRAEMWADVLLSGGFDTDLNVQEQRARQAMLTTEAA